jgi:hypothetical protein
MTNHSSVIIDFDGTLFDSLRRPSTVAGLRALLVAKTGTSMTLGALFSPAYFAWSSTTSPSATG